MYYLKWWQSRYAAYEYVYVVIVGFHYLNIEVWLVGYIEEYLFDALVKDDIL